MALLFFVKVRQVLVLLYIYFFVGCMCSSLMSRAIVASQADVMENDGEAGASRKRAREGDEDGLQQQQQLGKKEPVR